jgi:hypothetical protein
MFGGIGRSGTQTDGWEYRFHGHLTRQWPNDELTASIAHEVNQPLAAVVTNAEACLRWLDRGVSRPGRSAPQRGNDHQEWPSGR